MIYTLLIPCFIPKTWTNYSLFFFVVVVISLCIESHSRHLDFIKLKPVLDSDWSKEFDLFSKQQTWEHAVSPNRGDFSHKHAFMRPLISLSPTHNRVTPTNTAGVAVMFSLRHSLRVASSF